MEKKPFQKTVRFVNTKTLGEAFGTPLPEHIFQMWADPSNRAWLAIWRATTTNEEELEKLKSDDRVEYDQLEADFRWAISELIIDCDIEGLKFDTPEDVYETFNDPDVDAHFIHFVVTFYVMYLLAVRKHLVKDLRLGLADPDSSDGPAISLPQLFSEGISKVTSQN